MNELITREDFVNLRDSVELMREAISLQQKLIESLQLRVGQLEAKQQGVTPTWPQHTGLLW